jgi:hypothetical protein
VWLLGAISVMATVVGLPEPASVTSLGVKLVGSMASPNVTLNCTGLKLVGSLLISASSR